MGKETPVGGGVAYFGHSTDDDADFRAAMSLLVSSGHILITYSTTGINVKYDWMETGYWITSLSNNDGFAYSVFKSDTNDIYGVFRGGATPYTAPVYGQSPGDIWRGRSSGAQATTNNLTIAILQSTDILGGNEIRQYLLASAANQRWYGFPDSIATATTFDDVDQICANVYIGDWHYKFTVLAPIVIPRWGSGVATNARWPIYSDSRPALGAYTIGGYNFRAVGSQDYGAIFLRNGTSSSS